MTDVQLRSVTESINGLWVNLQNLATPFLSLLQVLQLLTGEKEISLRAEEMLWKATFEWQWQRLSLQCITSASGSSSAVRIVSSFDTAPV